VISKKFFSPDYLYVVAVSGGPDSMFLLDNLRHQGYKIVVAHVNYQKRSESEREEKLVSDYCHAHSLPLVIRRVKKEEYILSFNFQAWARQLRYIFFQEVAREYQTRHIAIAHHQQDHCETYWLQKDRKILVNYWGLPNFVHWGKFWIARPLLSFAKEQIIRYLVKHQINYALDNTNELPIYQRNRLRSQLVNLTIVEKNCLLAEIEKKNRELKKIKKIVNIWKPSFIVSRFVFRLLSPNLSPEIYLRLLYYWVNRATNGILRQRKKKLLTEIYKQLFISKKSNLTINLGKQWQIIKNQHQATIICNRNIK
jgi:tRNA(Ile)-lysidine synthase